MDQELQTLAWKAYSLWEKKCVNQVVGIYFNTTTPPVRWQKYEAKIDGLTQAQCDELFEQILHYTEELLGTLDTAMSAFFHANDLFPKISTDQAKQAPQLSTQQQLDIAKLAIAMDPKPYCKHSLEGTVA
ncbi:hypothetical protein [Acaryochloris thomasi]|uniref:hypothetical protein n=1 Tax=Acaryochloris thomasi TaxID=2929456 RepID=UPI000DA67E35|nr:hypothetical protein [Acaryochloris thomasi]